MKAGDPKIVEGLLGELERQMLQEDYWSQAVSVPGVFIMHCS